MTRSKPSRPTNRERGQSLTEFALIAPMFLVLVFGIIDFGMGLNGWITITNAAREGARLGAVYAEAGTTGTSSSPVSCSTISESDNSTIAGRSCHTADSLPRANVTVGVDGALGSTGESVKVKMTYDYQFVTPLGSFISGLVGPIHMETETDMRLE